MTPVTRPIPALLFAAALALPAPLSAESQSFAATATLPAGAFRAVRLTGIPADAEMRIALRTRATLALILLTEAESRRFPADDRALARLEASGDRVLTLRAPSRGAYVVILDNRDGTEPAEVALAVTVSTD